VFITWRLAGTLPRVLLSDLKASSRPANRKFAIAEGVLDAGAVGPNWLSHSEIAFAVRASILKGAAELQHYELISYVIMPNHVHLLIEPLVPIERITRGVKGVSAHFANKLLRRIGKPFWQDESFDHWVRTGAEAEKIIRYIENNPVKAGLVRAPEDWLWSSASAVVAQALLPVGGGSGETDAR
jgi:putative transposase